MKISRLSFTRGVHENNESRAKAVQPRVQAGGNQKDSSWGETFCSSAELGREDGVDRPMESISPIGRGTGFERSGATERGTDARRGARARGVADSLLRATGGAAAGGH